MRTTVYGEGLNKMEASCAMFRTSTLVSLRSLRDIVVLSLQDIAIWKVTKQ